MAENVQRVEVRLSVPITRTPSTAPPSRSTVRRGVKGGQDQALGTRRGGCTTKVHAVIDRKGRPLRFLLSGGQCVDGNAAVPLLKPLPPPKKLLADKAYDCAAFRAWLSRRGTTPVIPNKINRRKPYPHNKRAYRHRNKIERMFCRLKDGASQHATTNPPTTSSARSASSL